MRRWRTAVATVVGLGLSLAVLPTAFATAGSAGRIATLAEVPDQPVAVVFGAGLWSDGSPMPYLTARLELAKQLYQAGNVKAILVSGDNRQANYNEPDAMRNYLIAAGVPSDKVVADYAGVDTYTTCVRANRIFQVDSAILVSQTYHLPRAVTTCRAVGVDAWGVGDDSVAATSPNWTEYSLREWPANIKMVWDLVTQRQPVLGEVETSLAQAIEG